MIYVIKQEAKGCIKTRSTPASFSPATVKWAIPRVVVSLAILSLASITQQYTMKRLPRVL